MASALRHKHVRIDQTKLEKAKRILGARTDAETFDCALNLVVTEEEIDVALRGIRGKGKLRKVGQSARNARTGSVAAARRPGR